jgi:hypothetical protein
MACVLLDESALGVQLHLTDRIYNYGYRTPRFHVDFSLLVETDHSRLNARCTILSESGLACEISEPLQIDARVTLVFTLPGDATSIRTGARVTSRHVAGYGLAFIFCTANQRNYLREYIELRRSGMVLVEP